ncbi:thiamine pyrophosphate-dependent enzyme [Terrarubrum flagellatum]|uniref:thiamine pyrophosphate-dependent enzyme n=1 Tax=Terrirubrum flagellatum TaxID=2895980 RepID=UPI0031454D09
MSVIDTIAPPEAPSQKVASFKPRLLQSEEHGLCPGCGEPVAIRTVLEVIEELQLAERNIAILGHGCYGSFVMLLDVDSTLCLHGRAPATATGVKRMRPECAVWTLQGDGDMVNEGLAEILHATARAENITCIMLNNGVFGDTGGQMTAASVLGQRTKNSIDGRDAAYHGYPIPVANLVASLQGSAYVARGSVHSAAAVAQTRKFVRKAFQRQLEGKGLSLVEILTMCPTGWFVPAANGADYMMESLGKTYPLGELKDVGEV